ncbi:hypothetical protein BTA51_19995 [Hahella sp. CCB-MM4]|uniref:tetratricopeptide repeat protein n=1 Tax=Hahella sp. (strain CCB-MM4) TaxID=1926491 RepID=UPI000B9BD72A|nr:hypothetical protein [Hahella sp. CCB-MM4]OZG71567.1 hypothetical protein BTA51_19995 [Hahella sp. CCB-MM4]
MVRFIYLLILSFFSTGLYAFDMDAFRDAVSQHEKVYSDYTSSAAAQRLFDEGKVSEANDEIKNLVPDEQKTAYDYFLLGNMLFELDRESSFKFMKEAEKLQPDNPFILYERGIHEHRAGHYLSAEDYYKRFQDSGLGDGNPIVSAYLTHVYLMNRKVEDAFRAWKNAGFGNNHTSIEKAMYTVFSDTDQEHERESLIKAIKTGDTHKLCDLYELDAHWETDWWNHKPKENYLEYDRELAKDILRPGSRDEGYFKFCSSTESVSDEVYAKQLRDLEVLSGKGRLPESPALVYSILKNVMLRKLLTPQEFLEKFEPQLVSYSKQHPDAREYFDVLAYLYVNIGDSEKLRAIDLHGWKVLRIEKYAESYVVGQRYNEKEYPSVLEDALEDFPLSQMLNKLKLADAPPDKSVKREALIDFVASQFPDVKNNWKGPYRLNDFMASLRYELDQLND